MENQPVVRIQGVSKIIGGKKLIDSLTLDIPSGQVYGFLGPNGAGKTTTIRMIVGLMSITEGDILIQGSSIKHEFEEAIGHVGAIVENPEMYKFLSGYENLLHYARMSPGISKARIMEAVELVGMEHRIHDKVKIYSLGMRQRLGVAQAILHRPKLLVLDEPTNGLDPQGIRELRDYLRRLSREEGTTVFVSSHLLSEMELMCDTVAVIQQGRLIDVKELGHSGKADGPGGADQIQETVFEVNAPAAAQDLLVSLGFSSRAEENGVILSVNRTDAAQVNARLVNHGIAVYGIRPLTRSLEDQFLEMTGGGRID